MVLFIILFVIQIDYKFLYYKNVDICSFYSFIDDNRISVWITSLYKVNQIANAHYLLYSYQITFRVKLIKYYLNKM